MGKTEQKKKQEKKDKIIDKAKWNIIRNVIFRN